LAAVLVVEHDLDAQQLLAHVIESRGFRTIARRHSADALAYLREGGRPQLILVDANLPVMDGYQLRDALAADPELARIPVVLMTDVATVDRRRAGASPVLTKPLRVRLLTSLLTKHLNAERDRRPQSLTQSVLRKSGT
jgi:CheY-like chemotaxis protein